MNAPTNPKSTRRRSNLCFFAFHIILAAGILLLPFYRIGSRAVFAVIPSCILHDWFHVYCPLCGGTRAIEELLHFRLGASLRYHPFVLMFAVLFAVWYVIAWVRLFQGKSLIVKIPKPLSVALTIAFVAFWLLRNLLLIVFHIDPMGDLVGFWN